ncbi:MAG: hypothetical protein IJ491_09765 [Clostridia bacterium]|nr:hypothetical protein [Clostridia bacterium]
MITYNKVINAGKGLKKISDLDIKIREAIALSKLIKKLDEESVFYFEQREKICRDCGVFDKEKDAYFIPEENRETVRKKMNELDNTEVEFGEKLKINVSEGTTIDALSLILCEDFVEFIIEGDIENGN